MPYANKLTKVACLPAIFAAGIVFAACSPIQKNAGPGETSRPTVRSAEIHKSMFDPTVRSERPQPNQAEIRIAQYENAPTLEKRRLANQDVYLDPDALLEPSDIMGLTLLRQNPQNFPEIFRDQVFRLPNKPLSSSKKTTLFFAELMLTSLGQKMIEDAIKRKPNSYILLIKDHDVLAAAPHHLLEESRNPLFFFSPANSEAEARARFEALENSLR